MKLYIDTTVAVRYNHHTMKTIYTLVLAALLTTLTASARLGDTVEQLKARYGKPTVIISENVVMFEKGGFDILVTVHDMVAEKVTYNKTETDESGKNLEMTDNLVNALVGKNGTNWDWDDDVEEDGIWFSFSIEGHVAMFNTVTNSLTLISADSLDRSKADKDEAEVGGVEGL